MSNATRYNEGKIDFTLLPIDALEEEAKVWKMGEAKYGRDNWQKLWGDDTVNVVMQSLLRHAFAILKGELLDQESGLHHASHIRANAAMLIRHYNESNDYQFAEPAQHGWIQTYEGTSPPFVYQYSTTVQTGTGEDSTGKRRRGNS